MKTETEKIIKYLNSNPYIDTDWIVLTLISIKHGYIKIINQKTGKPFDISGLHDIFIDKELISKILNKLKSEKNTNQ